MNFNDAWNLPLDSSITVRDGNPPPSQSDGIPYNVWRSHNFTGIIREKLNENGWRYLLIEVSDTPEQVEYLAYKIAEDNIHIFEE